MTGLGIGGRPGLTKRILMELRAHWLLYLLVSIPVALLLVFHYAPLYGIQIAFKDYIPVKGVWDSAWVGLKHIRRFFTNYKFWQILRNTLFINLYGLATFPLSLILALLLHYVPSRRYKKLVQTVSYAPHFISMVVMCGIILQFFDARTGVFNALLGLFGVPPVNYMARPGSFYHIYIWTSIWQDLGYASIIYIAALAGVSPELHEAAIVDGASIVKRIVHVDIPGILPTFCTLLILRCGSLLSVGFEKILLLQNNLNSGVSEVISTYVYKQGLTGTMPQYSYSTAIGLFVALVNLAMLVTVNGIVRKLDGGGLW